MSKNKQDVNFNPRSPHGERPRPSRLARLPSVNFNPRSPHGERPGTMTLFAASTYFNPRSPHGERLLVQIALRCVDVLFQSTLPARGATVGARAKAVAITISIHAPRTGSDVISSVGMQNTWISIHAPRTGSDKPQPDCRKRQQYFNPRSPHGERPSTLRAGICPF